MIAKGMAKDEEQLRDWNRDILRLADELGKPCCATGDVHFLEPEDEAFRRILMAGQASLMRTIRRRCTLRARMKC